MFSFTLLSLYSTAMSAAELTRNSLETPADQSRFHWQTACQVVNADVANPRQPTMSYTREASSDELQNVRRAAYEKMPSSRVYGSCIGVNKAILKQFFKVPLYT